MKRLPAFTLALALLGPGLSGNAHIFPGFLPLTPVAYQAPFGTEKLDRYTDVWSDDGRLLLASRDAGVAVMELSESGAPRHLSTYAPASATSFSSVTASGNTAYLSSAAAGGVHLVDFSDLLAPKLLSRIDAANGGFDKPERSALHGDRLYLVSTRSSRVKIFDVGDPKHPALVRELETGDPGGLTDIVVAGEKVYVVGAGGGKNDAKGAVYIFHAKSDGPLSKPLRALETGFASNSLGVTPDGRFLVVSHRKRGGGVSIFDLSAAPEPRRVARVDASDFEINGYSAGRVSVADQVAYVAWHQGGVQVIDLDTLDILGRPQRVGVFGTASGISPLAGFVGNVSAFPHVGPTRVLLVDSKWGLYVVDATLVLPVPERESE
ncbi:MAG: hypothetical protein VCB42_05335 [Myxococcota bacterium]